MQFSSKNIRELGGHFVVLLDLSFYRQQYRLGSRLSFIRCNISIGLSFVIYQNAGCLSAVPEEEVAILRAVNDPHFIEHDAL